MTEQCSHVAAVLWCGGGVSPRVCCVWFANCNNASLCRAVCPMPAVARGVSHNECKQHSKRVSVAVSVMQCTAVIMPAVVLAATTVISASPCRHTRGGWRRRLCEPVCYASFTSSSLDSDRHYSSCRTHCNRLHWL